MTTTTESVRQRALRLLGPEVVAAVEQAPRAPMPDDVADRVAALLSAGQTFATSPNRAA